jgi:ATP-binding cassette subfamily C protein
MREVLSFLQRESHFRASALDDKDHAHGGADDHHIVGRDVPPELRPSAAVRATGAALGSAMAVETARADQVRQTLAVMWRVYRRQDGAWRVALPFLLLLAGLAEGVGLTMLLPLFIALNENVAERSAVSRAMVEAMTALGLQVTIGSLLSLLVIVIVAKAGLLLLVMRHVAEIVVRIAHQFRLSLIDALISARWGYFVEQPVGRLATAIGGEAERAAEAFLHAARFLADGLQVAVFLGFALVVSWQLTAAATAIGIVVIVALAGLTRFSRLAGRRKTAVLWSLTNRLIESVAWMKPLKASGRESLLRPLLAEEADDLGRTMRSLVETQQATIILQEPIIVIGIAAVLMVAAAWFAVPIDALAAIGFLLYRISSRIGAMQRGYVLVTSTGNTLSFVVDAIERAQAAREVHSGRLLPTLKAGIDFAGITLRLGSTLVFRDLTLAIKAGTLTVITGASGIGKTSLVDLLCGLYVPNAGEIRIDGTPLMQLDLAAWRGRIGYVPQEGVLVNQSILENIRLHASGIGPDRVEAALHTACAWEFVSALPDGPATPIGERGARLSGGQRQRLALARALVHDPLLLILDEATTGLDARTTAAVCQRLVERLGPLTIVAISHQPEWAEAATEIIDLSEVGVTHTPVQAP